MRKIIIVGNGSYALMMKKYIELTDFGKVCVYVVDGEYISTPNIEDIPVIDFNRLIKEYDKDKYSLVMGIGYTNMGNIRKEKFEECKKYGYTFVNYIHSTAIISEGVQIGEGNNILEGVILEYGVKIGNANLLFGGSMVAHETTIGDYNTLSVKSVIAGCSKIKNNCFIGANATVRDHVIFDDYVLIGAGAYGYTNMSEYSVVRPAKSVIVTGKKSTDYL